MEPPSLNTPDYLLGSTGLWENPCQRRGNFDEPHCIVCLHIYGWNDTSVTVAHITSMDGQKNLGDVEV